MSRFKAEAGPGKDPGVLAPVNIPPRISPAAVPADAVPSTEAPRNRVQDGQWYSTYINPLRKLTLYIALVFIFIRISLIHEIAALMFGFRAYLPLVFGVPALIGIVLTGGIKRGLTYPTTRFWIGHALWLMLATAFSTWPGGSLQVIWDYYKVELPMLFVIGCVVMTLHELRLVFYAVSLGGLFNVLSPKLIGGMDSGRQGGGSVTIGNSNDFAAHLIMVMPIVGLMCFDKATPKVIRLALLGVIGYGLVLVANTGSRGGLVALAVLVLMVILRSPGSKRIMMITVTPLLLVVAIAMLPPDVLLRYKTMFDDQAKEENSEAAASSSERTYLMGRAVDFTLAHPLFGVGPGQFSTNEGYSASELGRRGAFAVPHNSFLQVSSEGGFPALILFGGGLIMTYTMLNRTLKRARAVGNQAIASAALALMLSTIGFSTAAFFLSLAYRLYFVTLAGFAIALVSIAEPELSASPAKPPRS